LPSIPSVNCAWCYHRLRLEEGVETVALWYGTSCEPTVVSIDASTTSFDYKLHFNEKPCRYRAKCLALGLLTYYFKSSATKYRKLNEAKVNENLKQKETIEEMRREIEFLVTDANSKGICLIVQRHNCRLVSSTCNYKIELCHTLYE
jgi:hypothetical protein